MSVKRSDKQTLAVIVHTTSIVKKVAKDGQSGILMSFSVKKQKSTLAAYGTVSYIFPHKKNKVSF